MTHAVSRLSRTAANLFDMENRLSFDKIHIIEWLWKLDPATGNPDRRTGQEIYRELNGILAATGSRIVTAASPSAA